MRALFTSQRGLSSAASSAASLITIPDWRQRLKKSLFDWEGKMGAQKAGWKGTRSLSVTLPPPTARHAVEPRSKCDCFYLHLNSNEQYSQHRKKRNYRNTSILREQEMTSSVTWRWSWRIVWHGSGAIQIHVWPRRKLTGCTLHTIIQDFACSPRSQLLHCLNLNPAALRVAEETERGRKFTWYTRDINIREIYDVNSLIPSSTDAIGGGRYQWFASIRKWS